MSRSAMFSAAILFAAATLLAPSQAEARRRGLVVITHGDTVKELADVPSQFREPLQQMTGAKEPLKVGYYYSGFGIFGLDIWTWDGTYCLTADETYWPLENKQVEEMLGSVPHKPWNYNFPPGLFLVVGLIGVVSVFSIRKRKQNAAMQAHLQQLAEDPRYKQAVELFVNEMQPPQQATDIASGEGNAENGGDPFAENAPEINPEAEAARGEEAFNKAVQYLVDRGVEREEAAKNMGLLLAALTAEAE